MRLLLAISLLLVSFGSNALAQTREKEVLDNTLSSYIATSYVQLAQTTRTLFEHTDALCMQSGATNLFAARKAFHATVEAWSFIEWFRVGPVLRNNRVERFFFFPDRKSRGLRQVQSVLAEQNEAVLEVASLAKMSVALQGIGALDFLLFGTGADGLETGDEFRCQFARSVGANLNSIAETLADAWQHDQQLRTSWNTPSEINQLFRTDREAMNAIIGTLVHGLEAIRDTRLGVFLRDTPDRDRPRSAPLRRSGSTMTSIAANLEGLEALFTQSRIEAILPEEFGYLGDAIRFEFGQSIKTARELDTPLPELLGDAEQREKLVYLNLSLGFLLNRLNDELAPAAGLSAGFSFGDGD